MQFLLIFKFSIKGAYLLGQRPLILEIKIIVSKLKVATRGHTGPCCKPSGLTCGYINASKAPFT